MTTKQLLIRIAIALPIGLILGIGLGLAIGSLEGLQSLYVIAGVALCATVGFNAYRRQRQLTQIGKG